MSGFYKALSPFVMVGCYKDLSTSSGLIGHYFSQIMSKVMIFLALISLAHGHCGHIIAEHESDCPDFVRALPFTKVAVEEEIKREVQIQSNECPAPEPSPHRQKLMTQLFEIAQEEFTERITECENKGEQAASEHVRRKRSIDDTCPECKSERDVKKEYQDMIGGGGVSVTFITCIKKGDPIPNTTSLQTCGECVYLVELPRGFFPRSHQHRTCIDDYCLTGFGNCITTQHFPSLKKSKKVRTDIPFGKECCCQADLTFSTFVKD